MKYLLATAALAVSSLIAHAELFNFYGINPYDSVELIMSYDDTYDF